VRRFQSVRQIQKRSFKPSWVMRASSAVATFASLAETQPAVTVGKVRVVEEVEGFCAER